MVASIESSVSRFEVSSDKKSVNALETPRLGQGGCSAGCMGGGVEVRSCSVDENNYAPQISITSGKSVFSACFVNAMRIRVVALLVEGDKYDNFRASLSRLPHLF